jgi:hypothetical protein
MGRPLWRRPMRRLLAHSGRVLPLPRAWPALASPTRAAGRLRRTVGGHPMRSRSPRSTPTVLCPRPARGDGTARRVWGRHVWWAPVHGKHVRTRHRLLAALGSHGGKKRHHPRAGNVCLLTRRGLPRNCSSCMIVTEGSPRAFGPTHSPTPWPAESNSGPSGRDRIVHSRPDSDGRRRCHA